MKRVKIAYQAWGDLDGLWERIAAENPEAANRFILGLDGTSKLLAEFPGMGRPSPNARRGMM